MPPQNNSVNDRDNGDNNAQIQPTAAEKISSVQSAIDKLFRYKWLGVIGYLFFIIPILLLILALTPIGNILPDNIAYRGNTWWELLLGLLLTVIIGVFTFASLIRSATNRQIGWLVAIVVFFPLTFFYLLFGKTERLSQFNKR